MGRTKRVPGVEEVKPEDVVADTVETIVEEVAETSVIDKPEHEKKWVLKDTGWHHE